jgi:Asp-tRNA(Asn)/Glu-tRNA(Gln) amidotransferase A subunit family amidase
MAVQMDGERRRFLAVCGAAGLAGTLFPGALLGLAAGEAQAQAGGSGQDPGALPAITPEMIEQAAVIAGVRFTEDQRKVMVGGLTGVRRAVVAIRELELPNAVAPSVIFDPVPAGMVVETEKKAAKWAETPDARKLLRDSGLPLEDAPAGYSALEVFAFCTVRELGELLRTRKVTSVALTKMYLQRLKRYDAELHCVITLTEERAMRQAAAADREIAAGHWRGPLHGVPWGAKDLLAVKGYPTTWGAGGLEAQRFDEDATVVQRLDAAGAVLLAKLSLGALAQGDLWGGVGKAQRTRNPWNLKQGSSGSSAGSASAVAAGCVGFALGTETLGSISSPSTRCGVTGLRPSFGLVPRTGAMALSWSMDKIGAIARSVEDCALVVHAIYGPDGRDRSVQGAAFNPDFTVDVRKLRVGYIASEFAPPLLKLPERAGSAAGAAANQLEFAQRTAAAKAEYQREMYDCKLRALALDTLRGMGVALEPMELPQAPFGSMTPMLEAEAAAAFDELTRSGRDALLAGQEAWDWPNTFRVARLYAAVDYINAARARTLAVEQMAAEFAKFDVIVAASDAGQLTATNLCGQPAVIVPNGLRGDDAPPYAPTVDDPWPGYGGPGTPVSITFLAPLYEEAKACALARAYEQKTGFAKLHPKLG